MKKVFYSVFMLFFAVAVTTSCQKEIQPIVKQSLESKLSGDEDFAKMMTSAGELLVNLDLNGVTEESFASSLKANQGGITTNLEAFGQALVDLEDRYELSKLSASELQATIKSAYEMNPMLQQSLDAIGAKAGSDGAKICRGVVSLAGLLGGGTLCTVIGVSTIPVVGGVLCTVVTTLATGILNALCDLIP